MAVVSLGFSNPTPVHDYFHGSSNSERGTGIPWRSISGKSMHTSIKMNLGSMASMLTLSWHNRTAKETLAHYSVNAVIGYIQVWKVTEQHEYNFSNFRAAI